MRTDKEDVELLRRRCSEALASYRDASRVIDARLQARQNPTELEWAAEEAARAALVAARQSLVNTLSRTRTASRGAQSLPGGHHTADADLSLDG